MRFFYSEIAFLENGMVTLPENESKHLCKVLRKKAGDKISLINGKGQSAVCEISFAHYKKAELLIQSIENHKNENYHVHIGIAPTKNMDRIEWFVEKSTELGIHEISLLECENNERSKIKMERLEKIAISAMKQSKRFYKPKINNLVSLSEFLVSNPSGYIAHCEDSQVAKTTIPKVDTNGKNLIIIGPEGDFSLNEIENAKKFNYKPLSLGKTRLRTETAGVYAVMLLKFHLE